MGEGSARLELPFLTALSHSAPPQSGLRPASSTFYGIAATGSYFELDSLRDAPPGGEAFLLRFAAFVHKILYIF